jgi:hypothetical protein
MINFSKIDNHTIRLKFDVAGAKALLSAFSNALQFKRQEVFCDFEPTFFQSSNQSLTQIALTIILHSEEQFEISKYKVQLLLEQETIEYGIQKISECLATGVFFPAEFCDVKMNPHYPTIYCEFADN